MKMKKGQVAIFVIVGVVILLIMGIVFFYKLVYQKEKQEIQEKKLAGVPSQFLPVETVIDDCFKDTAEQAVRHVALHGGYFDPKPAMSVILDDTGVVYKEGYDTINEEFLGEIEEENTKNFVDMVTINTVDVGYWYYQGQDRIPPLSFIEAQVSFASEKMINLCLLDLADLNDFIFLKANETNIDVNTKILDNHMQIKFHYPLNIESKGINYQVKDKEIQVPIKFLSFYNTAKSIVEKIKQKPDKIPLSYLTTFNYNISIYPYENDIAYGVTNGETTLLFANKFN